MNQDAWIRISKLLCYNEVLWTEKEIAEINSFSREYWKNEKMIFDLASLFSDPDSEIVELINDKRLNLGTGKVDEGFYLDENIVKTYDNDNRYMLNQSIKTLSDKNINYTINKRLFIDLACQSRWSNIWTEIFSCLIHYDNVTEYKVFGHGSKEPRNGFDLESLKTIAYILKQMDGTFPFTTKGKRIELNSEYTKDFGVCVVPLLYSLCELSKEEKMFNIYGDFLKRTICDRIKAAWASFESVMLKNKDYYNDIIPGVVFFLKRSLKIRYLGSNIERIIYKGQEFSLKTKDDYAKMIRERIKFAEKDINNLEKLEPAQASEEARRIIMALMIMSNPGIYYRTSLLLEYEKSVGAKLHKTIEVPEVIKRLDGNGLSMVCETNWNSGNKTLQLVSKKYLELLEKMPRTYFDKAEVDFVDLLTSNSQGVKVEPEDIRIIGDNIPEKLRMINSVKQKRVASFVFDNRSYELYEDFVKSLVTDGLCTVRYQNGRRSRVIEIVPNVDQTAWALVLKVFNFYKVYSKTVAVGKQTGTVYDMYAQLEATGSDNAITIYSDVSGADASVQPYIATLFAQILAEFSIKNLVGPSKYFSCVTESMFLDNGIDEVEVPAIAKCLLTVIAMRGQKNYVLNDKITNETLKVKPAIFESGRFDTSAQHTTLFSLIQQVAYDEYVGKGKNAWKVESYKFGDDSMEIAKSRQGNMDLDDLKLYIDLSREKMLDLGFKIDVAVSRYLGDFLQQLAFNGRVVPKSPRSSIYCDERQITSQRDKIDVISVVASVIRAASQRGYAPENINCMIKVIWALIRYEKKYSKLRLVGNWHIEDDYIEYPLLAIFFPPLNIPNPNIKIKKTYLPRSGEGRTIGNSKLVWIINKLISDVDKGILKVVVPKNDMVEPFKVIEEDLKNLDYFNSTLLFSYHRTSKLSRIRSDKMSYELNQMADKLATYQNQYRIMTSKRADDALKTKFDITVPNDLLYWRRPLTRVEDLFGSILEKETEAKALNDELVLHLNKMRRHYNRVRREVNALSILIKKHENETAILDVASEFPLLPGYRDRSDFDMYLKVIGSAIFSRGKIDKVLSTFNKYGKSFPIERAIQIGAQCYAKGDEAFNEFMEAAYIPDELRLNFRELIESQNNYSTFEYYQSGFLPNELYGVRGDVLNLEGKIRYGKNVTNKHAYFLKIVLRDFLLYDIRDFDGHVYEIEPSLYSHYLLDRNYYARLVGFKP